MENKDLLVAFFFLLGLGLAIFRFLSWRDYVKNRKVHPAKTKKYVEKIINQRKSEG